ncbi:molybdopterin molybdotransferase MoeA [Streptosporangiaceae bacterium NEAU-GS5]|nr:molybdopterin molybdotransferase MoeA [Streptosporangiaceae bacterium NEAU-GS5]
MATLKPVDQHLADILAAVRPSAPLEAELERAHGALLAEDVTAPVALPPFDNSAMDGYAVRAEDVANAPVTLPVTDDVAAGDQERRTVEPGFVARIMTGAPLPAGADAVVPVELTDGGIERVVIHRSVPAGNAIRRTGEDVGVGDVVLSAGTALGAPQIGILAGVGRRHVLVRPRPRVAVLSTGSELAEPGTPLRYGQIWESNSYMLAAAVREAGADGFRAGSAVTDDPNEFLAVLDAQLSTVDAVITSGGVSMGAYEPVKEALAPLGRVKFEKVAMQPGMPQGFGLVGERDVPIFTLPGNPVSSFVSFVLFVRPALRLMQGLDAGPPETVKAITTARVSSPPGRRSYLRGVLDGGLVTPVTGQGSHQLAALAAANALMIVPEDVTELPEGSSVEVIPL